MSGYARGPFGVDWEDRIDFARLRSDRVTAAQEALRSSDMDALLLWKDENVRYLTSLRAQLIAGKMTSLNGVLLTRDAGPVLLCSGGEIDKASMGMSWLTAAHPIPIMEQRELVDGFVKATLAPLLNELGVAAGRLGVDQVNFSLVESMASHLPDVQPTDGDHLMQQVRLIKTTDEIAIIEEACAIGDSVTQRAIESSRGRAPRERGGRRRDADALLHGRRDGARHHAVRRLGRAHVAAASDLHRQDHPQRRPLLHRHRCDVERLLRRHRPDDDRRQAHADAEARLHRRVRGLMAGIDQMRPGRTNQDVADAIIAEVREHGFGDNLFSLFIGHGIGMGANEPPYIGETLPGSTVFDLKPGMVFAVEPLVWVPDVQGGGGVRIEDMVLVTEGDPRILSRVEYDDRLLD